MPTQQEQEAQQQYERLRKAKRQYEIEGKLDVDPTKVQEWAQLLIVEQLMQIKSSLQNLVNALYRLEAKLK
jgi:hypothetical protein